VYKKETKDPNTNLKTFQPKKLKISHWNARSINDSCKIKFIKALERDLIAIQEIWKIDNQSIQDLNILDLTERKGKRGGGRMTTPFSDYDLD